MGVVAVSEADVRHIATLARLGLESAAIPTLVGELNGILAHMDVLSRVDTSAVAGTLELGARGMPLRPDAGPPVPLARAREEFAPRTHDGFFLVPRLSTHQNTGVFPGGDTA